MSSEILPEININLIFECCHPEYIKKYSKNPKFRDEHYLTDQKYIELTKLIDIYPQGPSSWNHHMILNGKRVPKPNFGQYIHYLDFVWKQFYKPTIFSKMCIYLNFQGSKHNLNLHPLTTIGKLRETIKDGYQFTDIKYVKLVYKNKILDDNDLNLLSLNIKSNNDIIYIMTHEDNIDTEVEEGAPSPEPESSIVEPEAASPAPIPSVIQAEPINSTSNEITRLNDRINRLEATLESIIRHLDSAYEPE